MFNVDHIHPMLVHFPIALTLLGVLFATVSAILAAMAGGAFTPNFTNPVLAQAKDIHSTFAGFTVTFLCIASAFYLGQHFIKKYADKLHKIGFAFYVLAALAVSATGFLGGVIVYNDLLKM